MGLQVRCGKADSAKGKSGTAGQTVEHVRGYCVPAQRRTAVAAKADGRI
jgi:hypothetical protein